jgi:N-acylneuraminate cytidylyltransferase
MKLAVIPARGGSKRIPRKNIKPFHGQPIIGWSIAAARDSGCFDRIVVSTDDPGIAEVARELGAEVPFMRPPELSDDHAGTIPVIAHAVEWHRLAGLYPSSVCCIYATAPFVSAEDLREGLRTLERTQADYVFSATSYAFPIQRAIRLKEGNAVEMFDPANFVKRSQDLEHAYHDSGQFYWGRADAWTAGVPLFSPTARALVLPRWRVADIDTPEDWQCAELMFEAIRRRSSG